MKFIISGRYLREEKAMEITIIGTAVTEQKLMN
jgi:hypothetical protein